MIQYKLDGILVDYQISPAGIRLGLAENMAADPNVWVKLALSAPNLNHLSEGIGQHYEVSGETELWQMSTLKQEGQTEADPVLVANQARPIGPTLAADQPAASATDHRQDQGGEQASAANTHDTDATKSIPSDDEMRQMGALNEQNDAEAVQQHRLDTPQAPDKPQVDVIVEQITPHDLTGATATPPATVAAKKKVFDGSGQPVPATADQSAEISDDSDFNDDDDALDGNL